MHLLNGGYAGYHNARHRRSGHLFQGRFKAIVVEAEGHWLELSRYIHLNPVRARLVQRPEKWKWQTKWSSWPTTSVRIETDGGLGIGVMTSLAWSRRTRRVA